jgi:hypothetical protein
MARPLSGLFDIALEAKFTPSGTISTKARQTPDQPVSLVQSRDGPRWSDRFSLHEAVRVAANASKKSIGTIDSSTPSGERPCPLQAGLGIRFLRQPARGHCDDPPSLL